MGNSKNENLEEQKKELYEGLKNYEKEFLKKLDKETELAKKGIIV